ncbi:MAG: hypothetical protein ACYDD4_00705 [Acidimicrobiales bacterium]
MATGDDSEQQGGDYRHRPGVPKLTLGQRLLTALPNLDRSRPSTASTAPTEDRAKSEASEGDNTDEVVTPDAVIAPGGSTASRSRTRAPATGVRPNPYAEWSPQELKAAMRTLNDRERTLPMLLGPVIAALDFALTAVTLHNNPALHHKGHADPGSILAIGIGTAVLALLVSVSAFFRRRSFTIFALLFCGLGGGYITLLPAWGTAFWLFTRFNRMQKTLVSKTGGVQGARQRNAEARQKARSRSAERVAQRRGSKEAASSAPTTSKRYTPPKPTRTPPKG